ncbi:Hypothetical predicted protein [Prunus dulcis]|uniref:Uncharacterized protein n=1 Tax=Prunus dulcis TaxID=3755 RepID=A0A5E4FTX5_PRUDU|nr:Hypothetical predicted protein [Prunus dulcis]
MPFYLDYLDRAIRIYGGSAATSSFFYEQKFRGRLGTLTTSANADPQPQARMTYAWHPTANCHQYGFMYEIIDRAPMRTAGSETTSSFNVLFDGQSNMRLF